jgi:quercetin dioxygenase-like cupin family protein
MKDRKFNFHSTEMIVRVTTEETGGLYSVIEMTHLPSVGPALHAHPSGPESFVVLEGSYTFYLGDQVVRLQAGQGATAPQNVPHRYVVGPVGGRLMVISPPRLEHYFWTIAQRFLEGPVPLDEEFAVAHEYGQDFLDMSSHWGHK